MTDVETVIAARDVAVAAVTTTAANVDLATQQADRAEVARDAAAAPTAAQMEAVRADTSSAFSIGLSATIGEQTPSLFDATKSYPAGAIVTNPYGEIAQAIGAVSPGAYDSIEWTILNESLDLVDLDPKVTLVAADKMLVADSAASNQPKQVTAANVREYVATDLFAKLFGQIVRGSPYYVGWSGSVTNVMTQSRLYARPLAIRKGGSIGQVRVNVFTAAASSVIRLGLYAHDSTTGLPSTLIADLGTVDSSTTGTKTLSGLARTFADESLFWVVAVAQGGAPTVRVIEESHRLVPPVSSADAGSACIYADSVTGALPGTFPALGASTTQSRMPSVVFGA